VHERINLPPGPTSNVHSPTTVPSGQSAGGAIAWALEPVSSGAELQPPASATASKAKERAPIRATGIMEGSPFARGMGRAGGIVAAGLPSVTASATDGSATRA